MNKIQVFLLALLIGISIGYGYSEGQHSKPRPQNSPKAVKQIIKEQAKKHQLPYALVYAVAKVESGLNPRAVSNKSSLGVMQINGRYHAMKNPFDPEENIAMGCKLLRGYIDKYGLERGVKYYNSGKHFANNGYYEKVMAIYIRSDL